MTFNYNYSSPIMRRVLLLACLHGFLLYAIGIHIAWIWPFIRENAIEIGLYIPLPSRCFVAVGNIAASNMGLFWLSLLGAFIIDLLYYIRLELKCSFAAYYWLAVIGALMGALLAFSSFCLVLVMYHMQSGNNHHYFFHFY